MICFNGSYRTLKGLSKKLLAKTVPCTHEVQSKQSLYFLTDPRIRLRPTGPLPHTLILLLHILTNRVTQQIVSDFDGNSSIDGKLQTLACSRVVELMLDRYEESIIKAYHKVMRLDDYCLFFISKL